LLLLQELLLLKNKLITLDLRVAAGVRVDLFKLSTLFSSSTIEGILNEILLLDDIEWIAAAVVVAILSFIFNKQIERLRE